MKLRNIVAGLLVTLSMAQPVMATGWTQLSENQWKYFDNAGNLSYNTFIGTYWVGPDGTWIQSTIPRDELTNDSVGKRIIAVSKSAQNVELWENGQLTKTYACISGQNPGDKVMEGDRKTPVGRFFIGKKTTATAYTRALVISYPNAEDVYRGLQTGLISPAKATEMNTALSQGILPDQHTPLGGLIELHGATGKIGTNASSGCVVLSVPDIIDLYNRVFSGDEVRIFE